MVQLRRKLSQLPILYKILIGNVAVIAVGAIAGTWLTQRLIDRFGFALIALFALSGIVLSAVINFVIIKTALRPLACIQSTVEEVYRGNTRVRASVEHVGDPDIGPLATALNTMLDTLESHTQTIEAHRERLRTLSNQALYAQEEERKRIARELHDETSQALATLIINLEVVEDAISVEQDDVRQHIAAARKLATSILEGIRKLVLDLRPTMLDELGLGPAVQWYAKDRLERAGIKVSIEGGPFSQRLPSRVETALFRISQEAINNIIRHAAAEHARVCLEMQDSRVTLLVEDDGQGFDVEQVRRSAQEKRRLGLFGIEERVSLLRGTLTIDSQPGQGTRLLVAVPISEGREDEKDTGSAG